MKTKLFLLASVALIGCRTPQQLIDRAIKKDHSILATFNDTIQLERIVFDTIFGEDGDTIAIIQRVERYDTVLQVRYIHGKSRFDYKAERDSLAHALKMEKQKTKQNRTNQRTERSQERTERTTTRQEGKSTRNSGKVVLWALISLIVGFVFGWWMKGKLETYYFWLDEKEQE